MKRKFKVFWPVLIISISACTSSPSEPSDNPEYESHCVELRKQLDHAQGKPVRRMMLNNRYEAECQR